MIERSPPVIAANLALILAGTAILGGEEEIHEFKNLGGLVGKKLETISKFLRKIF